MHQKPMLNSPVELHSEAAEEFAKNVIARLEASHEARRALNYLFLSGSMCFTALNSTLNRKTLGAAG